MKEKKAFRIPFITKKQLKSRQALHRIFLKPQYKVYRGASILYFNASFSDVPSFSKMSQPPGQNQQMVLNSVVYHHPCPSRIASRLTLTFIRHLTLINSNLIKQKQKKMAIFLVLITNCSVYLHFMYIFHCNDFEYFVCSYCCKLFVTKFFYLLPQAMHSLFGVLPYAHVTCIVFFLIQYMQ